MSKLSLEQVTEICSLYKSGERLVTLSNKFNITSAGIIRLLKRNNIKSINPYTGLTDPQKDEVIKLYKSGISSGKLSKQFNVTKNYILRLLKSQNVSTYTRSSIAAKNSNLTELFSELITEWHPNNIVKPNQFSIGSEKKVWWICNQGHEWETSIKHRTYSNSGCPFCAGQKVSVENSLAKNYTLLVTEWNHTKNGDLKPEDFTQNSNRIVWWKCSQGHEWQAVICNRTKNENGCPYCTNKKVSETNNLQYLYPELANQWHPTKNGDLKPTDITYGSQRHIWLVCNKGHDWATKPNYLTSGFGCPHCSGLKPSEENNLEFIFPEIIKEWNYSRNYKLPKEYTSKSDKKVWWICNKNSKHEWEASIKNRTMCGSGCPYCWKLHYTDLEQFVETGLNIKKFDKRVLEYTKYKPDFQLSDDLYLNVDGLYWHSEKYKEKDYHFKLREAFEMENKRILQFYEDEIYNKWDIVKSIIDNSINNSSTKLNARECIIKIIDRDIAKNFYEANHLMGQYQAARHYGLFHDNMLVSIISVRIQEYQMEIARFGSLNRYSIRGGFSKLLSHVIRIHNPKSIVSFCDLRYATGKSYETLGFKRVGITQGWSWTDGINRFNRLACKAGNNKTERETAAEKGWFKIYDAGQAKYVIEL